jgi:hypothetical protein
MRPANDCAPAGGTVDAREDTETLGQVSVPHSHAGSQRRRLPAFGRAIRANLLAGKRPRIGGGCVCITTDWAIHIAIPRMVCEPIVPAGSWDLTFLAGVEVLLLTRAPDAVYATALRDAMLDAGSPLVALCIVPEAGYGR